MFYAATSWLALSLIFALISYFAIWARTNNNTARKWSVVTFVAGSLVSAGFIVISMGWSFPCIGGITAPSGNVYKILGFEGIPEKVIYLFVDIPDKGPRICHIPWSNEKIEKLIQGQEEQTGSYLIMKSLGDFSGNGEDFGGAGSDIQLPPKNEEPPKEQPSDPVFTF